MEDVGEMKKEGSLCMKKDVPFWSRVTRPAIGLKTDPGEGVERDRGRETRMDSREMSEL